MNARTDLPPPWLPLPGVPEPAPAVPAKAAEPDAAAAERVAVVLRLQAAAMAQPDWTGAAAAVATELATVLGCERVAIGWRTDGSTVVKAESHRAEVAAARAPARALAAAMDEALDQQATLVHPMPPGSQTRIVRAHDELSRAEGGASLCTVPLADGGELLGALLLERQPRGFGADEVVLAEHCACLLAPLLALKRRQQRSLARHALDELRGLRERLLGPGHPTAKLLMASAAGAALMLAASAAVPGAYRVSADARIEGAVQRVLTAPVDGFVHQVHVRPGDVVQQGQLLAELSRDELQLERRRWQSEAQQQEHAYGEALARHERTQMVIALSRADEARAQLELAEQSIRRSRLEAPFDGVVIQGDLSQSLGAPVKRGDVLLTLAQGEGYRVIVEVDERDIADVKPGQTGTVTLAAAPARPLPIRVTRVTPVAATVDGRNAFEVEADVQPGAQPLRPGLRGAARIDAGERPLLWIATHRVVDWLRLQWWLWLA